MPGKKGKLIVVEGLDGSGKSTQLRLILERMKKEKKKVVDMHFPRYGATEAGTVEEYIKGGYGSVKEVGGYRATVFFAVDRFGASQEMWPILSRGSHIAVSRYVTSNPYQAETLRTWKERELFWKWNEQLEYDIMKIPKPDVVIYFDVPASVCFKNIAARKKKEKKKIQNPITEKSEKYLARVEKIYKHLGKRDGWHMIKCMKQGKMRSPQDIHEEAYAYLEKHI